jgi:tetratricopeptide (TPR) repeat protein
MSEHMEAEDTEYSNEALRKLGARIRHLRRKRAMTQRDLSFEGCSYSYLARIEAGDRRPSPRVLIEIARRLGVSAEELTGETSSEQRSRSLQVLEAAMMIRLGQLDEAGELLSGVLHEAEVEADPARMSEAYEGLGVVAARSGRDRQAIELLERAREVAGDASPGERVELFTTLFAMRMRSGDTARAIALAEDCLARLRAEGAVDPAKLVRYSTLLSRAYAEVGDFGRANSALAAALGDRVEEADLAARAEAYHAMGRRYAANGQIDLAIRYTDRALLVFELIDDDRTIAEAHLVFAQRLLDAGDATRAAAHLAGARAMIGTRPEPEDLGFLLVEEARCALLAGDTAAAGTTARRAIEVLAGAANPGQLGDAYLVLARVEDELGEEQLAESAYRSAIEAIGRDPGWNRELAKAYRWYGKFLKRAGRAAAALEAFELAADLAPSNQDTLAPAAGLDTADRS